MSAARCLVSPNRRCRKDKALPLDMGGLRRLGDVHIGGASQARPGEARAFRSISQMKFRLGSRAALMAVVGAAFLAAGCTSIRDHQGYILDDTLATAIQPGV